jgi:hypothetical protein
MESTQIDLRADSIERVACRLALAQVAPLLPLGVQPADIFERFYFLCKAQQYRLDNHLPTCPIPLWVVALLNHFDYGVDIETAVITDWPHPLPDWLQIEVDMDTGRIIGWPVNAPTEVHP